MRAMSRLTFFFFSIASSTLSGKPGWVFLLRADKKLSLLCFEKGLGAFGHDLNVDVDEVKEAGTVSISPSSSSPSSILNLRCLSMAKTRIVFH